MTSPGRVILAGHPKAFAQGGSGGDEARLDLWRARSTRAPIRLDQRRKDVFMQDVLMASIGFPDSQSDLL